MTEREIRAAFHEHGNPLYRFAWRMTNSSAAADDIVQDVFLSVLRYPERFDPNRGPLRSFLFAVARNLALKKLRDENRWDVLEEEQFIAEPINIMLGDTALIVEAAIKTLPPLQREVLVLAEYEELSLEEIARTVESEVGTVKARLYRARENLRRMLAPLKQRNERSIQHGTVKRS
jgi:RNA polymerase sigma-70 factor (ECF subfamily)